MFYKFRQNNSGGFFKGPAVNVFIEANNQDEAVALAPVRTDGAVYFGCGDGCGCSCCGDRWSAYVDEETEQPELIVGGCFSRMKNEVDVAVIHYNDGTKHTITEEMFSELSDDIFEFRPLGDDLKYRTAIIKKPS